MDRKVVPNAVLLEDAATLMAEGREVSLTPLGFSMLPFIRGGKDTVRLKKAETVTPGDILLVRLPGPRYVLHRLIHKEGENLTLMGDGNLSGTESCTQADVLGTVTAIERGRRVIVPGTGRWWRRLPYLVRRIALGFIRRVI